MSLRGFRGGSSARPEMASFGPLAFGAVLLLVLMPLATGGLVPAAIALGIAASILILVVFGPDKAGLGCLGLALLTAPMYKGLVPVGTPATPTDVFLAAGFGLLLPRILSGRLNLPTPYLLGVGIVTVMGLVSSAASSSPAMSLVGVVLWLLAIFFLPVGIAAVAPDNRTVDALAWMYVAGQLFNTAYALVDGPTIQGRYLGLTLHPNIFGQAGLIAFALLLHLLHRTERKWIVYAAMFVCLGSIYMSGSRAATLCVVGLVLLIPIVERSAVATYLISVATAGGIVVFSTLLTHAGSGSSLERITGGDATAAGSDIARKNGLSGGISRFLEHPILGNGFIDIFDVHNNYVEVALAVGVFGLVGFLTVIWALGRGLFGASEMRRLCYVVAAFAVLIAFTPGLYDLSLWVAVALAIVVQPSDPEHNKPTDQRARRRRTSLRARQPGRQRVLR